MSSVVRRVPVNYEHPRENTHEGTTSPNDRYEPLHDGCRFVEFFLRNEKEREELVQKKGFDWNWAYNYHFKGYFRQVRVPGFEFFEKSEEEWVEANPKFYYGESEEHFVIVRDENHLLELLIERFDKNAKNYLDPQKFTPIPRSEEELESFGFALYEEISDGTPITPVFDTKEKLIDFLVHHGDRHRRRPYSRENAKTLVYSGHSFASMVMADGRMLDSTYQAAEVEAALS